MRILIWIWIIPLADYLSSSQTNGHNKSHGRVFQRPLVLHTIKANLNTAPLPTLPNRFVYQSMVFHICPIQKQLRNWIINKTAEHDFSYERTSYLQVRGKSHELPTIRQFCFIRWVWLKCDRNRFVELMTNWLPEAAIFKKHRPTTKHTQTMDQRESCVDCTRFSLGMINKKLIDIKRSVICYSPWYCSDLLLISKKITFIQE